MEVREPLAAIRSEAKLRSGGDKAHTKSFRSLTESFRF
jgi:hypothetical protein